MKAGPASFSAERGGGPKSDGSAAMRSGSALFEERKGGRMRLKPRAIWGMSAFEGLDEGIVGRYAWG